MNSEEHASWLMSEARRQYHNPEKILKQIGVVQGMVVADLGCGPGFFTIPLATMVGRKGLVYAVDADPAMLKRLQTNIGNSKLGRQAVNIKIVQADVSKTGIPAGSVDIALFANVLHDIDDKKSFLKEVRRMCKAEVQVVDVDWEKVKTERGPPLDIRLSEEESKQLLFEEGFKFAGKIQVGSYHYGLVFRRL